MDSKRKADTVRSMDKQRQPRRTFTEEFKVGAVKLVLDENQTIAKVARDLGLTPLLPAHVGGSGPGRQDRWPDRPDDRGA